MYTLAYLEEEYFNIYLKTFTLYYEYFLLSKYLILLNNIIFF